MTFTAKICGLTFGGNHPPHVMGILNLSPESFYKNSVRDSSSILEAAQKMIDDGAAMLDVGARSTSPWAETISVEEEKSRLFSALKELSGNISAPISVDTMYADVAEGALNRGADIINDISSLKADGRMGKVIADYDAGAVLMATRKIPGDPLGMEAVMSSLFDAVSDAKRFGIDPQKIVLDPAIGHWISEKTPEYDFDVINRFEKFNVFEMPILIAVSRKSFLNAVVDKPAEDRLIPSLAAASIAAYKGGHIIRTHDVSETADAVKVIHAIRSQKEIV
ncbi:MAG: dihydropteroate synthase [Methanosarcinales archaeon]|jgi:dihydropteroate synthase|nr:dihydropteroate synthase [Methanosarcinales archaeon]